MNHTIRSLPHSICRALSRISAGLLAAAVLTAGLPQALAAPTAQVSGGADVVITGLAADHSSSGAQASAEASGDSTALLQTTLTLPGAWARFSITVENRGDAGAVLSRVVQQDETSEELLVSFGISDQDAGEQLAPGERCTVSIVVQLDPELNTQEISTQGDFSLELVYDAAGASGGTTDPDSPDGSAGGDAASGASPQTGDSAALLPAAAALVSTGALLTAGTLIRRRRRS